MTEKELRELAIAKAKADLRDTTTDEAIEAWAQHLMAEMKRYGAKNSEELEAEKRRMRDRHAMSEAAAAVNDAAEDAEQLEWINEWRAEDGLPLLSAISEASLDELEAACEGNPRLLLRRR